MFSEWLAEALGMTKNHLKASFNKFPLIADLKGAIYQSRGKRTRILAVVDKSGQPCETLTLTIRGRSFKYMKTLKAIMIEPSEDAIRWFVELLHAELHAMLEVGDETGVTAVVTDSVDADLDEIVECCAGDIGDDELAAKIEQTKADKDLQLAYDKHEANRGQGRT